MKVNGKWRKFSFAARNRRAPRRQSQAPAGWLDWWVNPVRHGFEAQFPIGIHSQPSITTAELADGTFSPNKTPATAGIFSRHAQCRCRCAAGNQNWFCFPLGQINVFAFRGSKKPDGRTLRRFGGPDSQRTKPWGPASFSSGRWPVFLWRSFVELVDSRSN